MLDNNEEDHDELGQRHARIVYLFDRKVELSQVSQVGTNDSNNMYTVLRSWVKDESESVRAPSSRSPRPSLLGGYLFDNSSDGYLSLEARKRVNRTVPSTDDAILQTSISIQELLHNHVAEFKELRKQIKKDSLSSQRSWKRKIETLVVPMESAFAEVALPEAAGGRVLVPAVLSTIHENKSTKRNRKRSSRYLSD